MNKKFKNLILLVKQKEELESIRILSNKEYDKLNLIKEHKVKNCNT
jgi:hypothetical protein